jgi:multiple sugar transport system substrate-binding protein
MQEEVRMLGSKKSYLLIAVALLLATTPLFANGQGEAEAGADDGTVTLAVYGDQGHNLVPFEWIREEAAERGIQLEVVGVPFTEVYEKLKTEFVGQTGAYDVVVFYPAYLGEFADFGYLRPLDEFFSMHDPELDDIVPAYRDLYMQYDDQTYALPYDGDVLNFYYRTDIFEHPDEQAAFEAEYGRPLEVPETWDETIEVAEFFTRSEGEMLAGEELDQDFYGFAFLGARGFAYAWWLNIYGSLGGVYFDRDLNPQINSEIGVEATEILLELKQYSPPDVMSMGYEELRNAYLQGRVGTMVQWSDVWKKANDPDLSVIVGDAKVAPMPGTRQPDGSIEFRAAAPVGRVIGIPASSEHAEEAYWVAWKLTTDISTETVSTSETGLDPYRQSHVENAEAFQEFGTTEQAQEYLDVVMTNLNHVYPDLNIPGSAEYLDALDIAVTRAVSGDADPQAALDRAANEWNEISETLGRDRQRQIYNNILDIWEQYGFWED